MSYQPSKMGVTEATALICMATISRIFMSGLPRMLETSGQLLWLSIGVAGLITNGMVYLLILIFQRMSGDLVSIVERIWGKIGAWVVALYYIVMLYANVVLLIRQYAENTLLTALPYIEFQQALMWYVVPAVILIYFGIEAMARGIWMWLPIIALSFIIVWILIIPFCRIYNLFPILATGPKSLIPAFILAPGFDIGAILIIVLAPAFQDARTLKAGLFAGLAASSALKSITSLFYVLVFGVNIGQEKILPFFELSRLVYLSRYVQRIESLFILMWVMSGVMAIAIQMYAGTFLLARLVNLPTFRPIIPSVAIMLIYLSMFPPSITDVIRLDGKWVQYANIGVYLIPGLLYITFLFSPKKRSLPCEKPS